MNAKLVSPVLILGARSDIARALARAYAHRGCDLILGARRAAELEDDCRDLMIRSRISARAVEFDVNDQMPDRFFSSLSETPGTVVMVVGLLGEQERSAAEDQLATQVMQSNYINPARYLLAAARAMSPGSGATIVGISSVAGDRGRGSNFVYGSAKAGLTAFLSGLRNSLSSKGIHVLTVKPGFVDTRMTAGMNLPKLLTAQPDDVAHAVIRGHEQGKDLIYVKSIWRFIMLVITLIPERIFKKLSL